MTTIPTITELRQQILDDIYGAETSSVLRPRALFTVLATAFAAVLHVGYRFGLWLFRQIFTVTMDEDALEFRSSEYGITRGAARPFQGTIAITGVDGTVVSSGELFQVGGVVYETTDSATVSSGTAENPVRSLGAGDSVNLQIGDALSIVTPREGLDGTATVATVTQSGEDPENVEDLRARLLFRQRNRPQGGATPDFIEWATSVPGIREAFVGRPQPGYVTVYPLADGAPESRIPTPSKLSEVSDYINDEQRHPFGRATTIAAMTELSFDVAVSNLTPNTPAMQALGEAAIRAYLFERRPRQYSREVDPPSRVSASGITSALNAAGATNSVVTLTDEIGTDVSGAGVRLSMGQLAKLGTLTWA